MLIFYFQSLLTIIQPVRLNGLSAGVKNKHTKESPYRLCNQRAEQGRQEACWSINLFFQDLREWKFQGSQER